jgi:hypothetical protein
MDFQNLFLGKFIICLTQFLSLYLNVVYIYLLCRYLICFYIYSWSLKSSYVSNDDSKDNLENYLTKWINFVKTQNK